jgi:hypothetical protein
VTVEVCVERKVLFVWLVVLLFVPVWVVALLFVSVWVVVLLFLLDVAVSLDLVHILVCVDSSPQFDDSCRSLLLARGLVGDCQV